MNRKETIVDLAVRAVFMVAVYIAFASQLPSYTTVPGIGALLDGAVLIGLAAVGVGVDHAGRGVRPVHRLARRGRRRADHQPDDRRPRLRSGGADRGCLAGAFGALQGLLIAFTGINSLVFTIGTLIGLRGLALIISNENSVTVPIERISEIDFIAPLLLRALAA